MQDPKAADAHTLARETRKKLEVMVLLLATRTALAGHALLVQAWVPTGPLNALKASGMPYAAIGSGDALSMLHYASAGHVLELSDSKDCPIPHAYSSRKGFFHTDLSQLAQHSVTRCPQTLDAITCSARNTFVIPVWDTSTSYLQGMPPLAVLEFLSTAPNLPHPILQQHAAVSAEQAGAWACIPLQPWPVTLVSDAHAVITVRSKPLPGRPLEGDQEGTPSASKTAEQEEERKEEERRNPHAPTTMGGNTGEHQQEQHQHSLVTVSLPEVNVRPRIETAEVEEPPVQRASADEEFGELDEGLPYGAAGITSTDLRAQFGEGLQDAAKNLGISVTTLKRACRRHGISRWPRRDLKRLQQALANMETIGAVAGAVSTIITPGTTPHAPLSLEVGRKRSGGTPPPTLGKRKTAVARRASLVLANNDHLWANSRGSSPGGSSIENAAPHGKRAPPSASPLGSAFGPWAPAAQKEVSTPGGGGVPPANTDLSVPEMSALQALYAMQSLATPAAACGSIEKSLPDGKHDADDAMKT